MSVNYKLAFPLLDTFEGGLVYIESEGQWTNKGIQWNTYVQLCEQLLHLSPEMDHFSNLSRDEWGKFVQYYWNIATWHNSIKSGPAALVMFNAFFASGYGGIKKIQAGLNSSYNAGLTVDGIVGSKTIKCINWHANSSITMWTNYYNYLMHLVTLPAYWAFKKGWIRRMNFIKPVDGVKGVFFFIFIFITLFLANGNQKAQRK